ncbi:unnamed protein product, partial [Effrenium voratum]
AAWYLPRGFRPTVCVFVCVCLCVVSVCLHSCNQNHFCLFRYHWGRSKPSRGSIFCAAPVRDLHDIRQMQYWAVGVSCCSQGDFWCDDAKDSKAQGGIVIFDNEGFFSGSSFDEYQKAAKKAEATHHLLSVHHPMYIRWAHKDNLDKVANEYNMKAGLTLTAFSLAYAAVSAAMAVALAKPHGPHVMGR